MRSGDTYKNKESGEVVKVWSVRKRSAADMNKCRRYPVSEREVFYCELSEFGKARVCVEVMDSWHFEEQFECVN